MVMTFLKRLAITVLVIAILGALAEFGLRAFMPSVIEGGVRVPLRVAQESRVDVSMEGSAALNALRWRIADVSIEAENVPLDTDVTATAEMQVASVPLFPLIGKLRDGTATLTIAPEHLEPAMRMMTAGAVEWAEMRDGQLFAGGTLDTPQAMLPFQGVFDLAVESGDVVVTPSELTIEGAGVFGDALLGELAEPRTVCIADRLPRGITLTGIAISPEGEMALETVLSEGLISNPQDRFRGSCA